MSKLLNPRQASLGRSRSAAARIVFLADTHLGFDMPVRPRVTRRRRGPDFFENYQRVLAAAAAPPAHLVVHGGDLLFRRRVPAALVQRAMLPLKRLADSGVPVYLVPGNHERSEIPFGMLAIHPNIHIFDRPRTFVAAGNGLRIALGGFPYCRDGVRARFRELVEVTGVLATQADVRLLCVHQCFEGATVGPHHYTFRHAPDVVRMEDVPPTVAAVLAGHIHRHQVLTADQEGRPAAVPVLYPGSIERTSFAEKDEPKGYLVLDVEPGNGAGGVLAHWEFRALPTRPMVVCELRAGKVGATDLEMAVRDAIMRAPIDAILRLRVSGDPGARDRAVLATAQLRRVAPPTMNVEVRVVA